MGLLLAALLSLGAIAFSGPASAEPVLLSVDAAGARL